MRFLCMIGCHRWAGHAECFRTRICMDCARTEYRHKDGWTYSGHDDAAIDRMRSEDGQGGKL